MITPNEEEIMVWFTVGLMVGGFLGMLFIAIFVSNKKREGI